MVLPLLAATAASTCAVESLPLHRRAAARHRRGADGQVTGEGAGRWVVIGQTHEQSQIAASPIGLDKLQVG